MIVCAGEIESFGFALPIGIGLVDSAANLTRLILQESPKEIIFIGTCGLYFDGKLLEIYESYEALNVEIAEILKLGYSPILSNLHAKSCEKLYNVSYETAKNAQISQPKKEFFYQRQGLNFKTNSSNFITTDKEIAEKFYKMGFFMENMELFSVLRVASLFKIPAVGYLCATNFCDKDAHKNFIENHQEAKKRLENFIKNKGIV